MEDTTKPVKHFRPHSPISKEVKAEGVKQCIKALSRIIGYYQAEQLRSGLEAIPFVAADALAREFNRKADLLDAREGKLVYHDLFHHKCSRNQVLGDDGETPDYVIDKRLEILVSVESILKLIHDDDFLIHVYTPDNYFTVEIGE